MAKKLVAALVRATLAGLGAAAPLTLIGLRTPSDLGPPLALVAAIFLAALVERRRSGLAWAFARTFVVGGIGSVAVALGQNLLDPESFIAGIRQEVPYPIAFVFGGFIGVLSGLPILVRSRSDEGKHLALAVVVLLVPLGIPLAFAPRIGAPLIASIVLAAAGLGAGDRFAAWIGVPRPEIEKKGVGAAFQLWVTALIPLFCFIQFGVLNNNFGRRSANHAAAIGGLKTIGTAQMIFRDKHGAYAASLADLSEARLIDSVLGGGSKQGYSFRLVRAGDGWAAAADPLTPQTGWDHLWTNQEGAIFYTTATVASFLGVERPAGFDPLR